MLAGCFTFRHDVIRKIEPDLPRLESETPVPVWQCEIEAQTVDIMELLPGNRLFVGTIESRRGIIHFPLLHPGELIMMHTESGETLWSYPRSRFRTSFLQTLIADQPYIVIGSYDENGFQSFHALDPEDGTPVWEKNVPASQLAALPDPGMLAAAFMGKEGLEIKALDLSTGITVWERTLSVFTSENISDISFLPTGKNLLVTGGITLKISADDGKTLWQSDIEASLPPVLSGTMDTLFKVNQNSLTSLETADGRRKWEWKAPAGESVLSAIPEEGMVMVISGLPLEEGIETTVNALSYDRGALAWRFEVPGRLSSSVFTYPGSGNVYFSTLESFFTVDASTGRLLNTEDIPLYLQGESLLPDIIAPLENSLALVREEGTAVFSLDGEMLFSSYAEGGFRYTSVFSSSQYEDYMLAQIEPSERIEIAALKASRGPGIDTSGWYYDSARRNKEYVYQRTEYARKSDYAFMRESARNERIHAVQAERRAGIAQAQTDMAHAIGNVLSTGAIVIMQAAIKQIAENLTEWTEYQTGFAGRLHSNSINGRYYIRPVYSDGWRLFVVDLLNNMEGTLLLSPSNEALKFANAQSIFSYAVDEESSRVFTAGLGMDFENPKTYVAGFWYNLDQKIPRYTIPYPSVMSFKLDDIMWNPVTVREVPVKQIDPLELELIEASKLGDLDKVNELLEAGVSPDSADSVGKSALIHAVQNFNTKVVSLLIDSGADIYYEDELGWTAIDFTQYPIGARGKKPAKEGMEIRKTLLRAHRKNLRSGERAP